ncbi:MAG: aminoglycoside phosphotransferase family protein [Weeksellaceae bacterium]
MVAIDQFLKSINIKINSVNRIAVSGSGRVNYIVESDNEKYILTNNKDVKENETFFYLSKLFKYLNANVPEIIKISEDKTLYLQQFVGEETLLDKRLKGEDTSTYYHNTVKHLARLQIATAQVVDKSKLYDSVSFDSPLVYRDLFYFKNYFLDLTSISYSQSALLQEFEQIVTNIENAHLVYFILRDFQGRNVMIQDNQPYFIDYQDGMFGPIAYDLVSLLWQAKAKLTAKEKEEYIQLYTRELQKLIPKKFDYPSFKKDYNNCLILRLLQVMGAYGKLGLMQNKPHFKESISFGIQNLKSIQNETFMQVYPTLQGIINQMDDHIIQ